MYELIPEQAKLVVAAKIALADGLVGLELRKPDGARLPDWTVGAHIDLIMPNGFTRQYSLSGNPRDAFTYRVGILREPDSRGGSAYVHDDLHVGDIVGFGGPRNNFALVPSARLSFIAGGVGITPILAMLRQAEAMGCEWRLLYLGREISSMAYVDELRGLAGQVEIHPATNGRVDVAAWLGEYREDTKFYVCGPARLLDAVEAHTRGWRPGWVRMERFAAQELEAPARTGPFAVHLARSGKEIIVHPDQTVAEAIRAAGVPMLTSCGAGLCGTCETTVIAGEPDHRDSLLTDSERQAGNCMFPCVSRSLSDHLTLEL